MITEINVHEQLLVIEFRRELEIFHFHPRRSIMAADRERLKVAADEIDSAGRRTSKDICARSFRQTR